jgi:hypothetical protein
MQFEPQLFELIECCIDPQSRTFMQDLCSLAMPRRRRDDAGQPVDLRRAARRYVVELARRRSVRRGLRLGGCAAGSPPQ